MTPPKAKAKKPRPLRTPPARIRAALRALWLWSNERNAAVKREGNTCECCGKKGSKSKGREVAIEVHHLDGVVNWQHLIEEVQRHLLCDPSKLAVLCRDCHTETHRTGEF